MAMPIVEMMNKLWATSSSDSSPMSGDSEVSSNVLASLFGGGFDYVGFADDSQPKTGAGFQVAPPLVGLTQRLIKCVDRPGSVSLFIASMSVLQERGINSEWGTRSCGPLSPCLPRHPVKLSSIEISYACICSSLQATDQLGYSLRGVG